MPTLSPRDIALTLLVVLIWGVHNAVIRIGVLEIPPLLLLTIRMLGTAVIFLPFVQKISREQFANIARWSLVFIFMHIGTLAVGLHYIDVSLASLIIQTNTPFAIVLGWILHKEKFGAKTAAGLALAFIGVMLVLYKPGGNFTYLGATFILISAFTWALGSLLGRKTADISVPTLLAYGHLIPAPLFAFLSYLYEPGQIHTLIYDANWFVLAGVFSFQWVIASSSHALWRGLVVRNPVFLISCFTFIQPVITVAIGHYLLGEDMSIWTWIGGAISMVGVMIVLFRRAQRSLQNDKLTAEPNPDVPNV